MYRPKWLGNREQPRPETRWWNEKGDQVLVSRRPVYGSAPKKEVGWVWFIPLPDQGQGASHLPLDDFMAQYTQVSRVTKPTRHLRYLKLHISRVDSATLTWTAKTRRMSEEALAEEILTKAAQALRANLNLGEVNA